MPKLIDYPRTTYAGAWELGEIVDDTGGKCAIDTAARKLNRKVSGSFKAIIGSAVKFGLLTSKRDLLTTTTLFKRIKHAYDKQEELVFHREAFLTPPLFTQLCRKFRSRELPVQMLDVMLIREFSVEEINAPGVAKAFVEGCRMIGLLDEHNIIADIDALTARNSPQRELANPSPSVNTFRREQPIFTNPEPNDRHILSENSTTVAPNLDAPQEGAYEGMSDDAFGSSTDITHMRTVAPPTARTGNADAIANLFGLAPLPDQPQSSLSTAAPIRTETPKPVEYSTSASRPTAKIPEASAAAPIHSKNSSTPIATPEPMAAATGYQIEISGPGVSTRLSISGEEDIMLAVALLEKIRRQLKGN